MGSPQGCPVMGQEALAQIVTQEIVISYPRLLSNQVFYGTPVPFISKEHLTLHFPQGPGETKEHVGDWQSLLTDTEEHPA